MLLTRGGVLDDDAMGVLAVVSGAVYASVKFLLKRERPPPTLPFEFIVRTIGCAILLGLELLVAGDIVKTVVVSPTMENVSVLEVIVLSRTFLSMSLQLELKG